MACTSCGKRSNKKTTGTTTSNSRSLTANVPTQKKVTVLKPIRANSAFSTRKNLNIQISK